MKKVTFIIFTGAIYLIGCTNQSNDDHGHDHGPNGEHLEEGTHEHDHDEDHGHEHHEQEDFVVNQDTTVVNEAEETDHGDHDHKH